ncbi:hypothetical protein WT60_12010 [Burkholderia sp. MSMB617WGS]|nr:hypothetical protein WS78_11460 [Burkholderia savannae]AOK47488.1 hypothetical protein WT60_12010 [Burkholderia sp. MSMB617WGS]KVG47198.1 hypothetical protein WS77_28985 [Burkholderia sp. MSMB0265]KVG77971.1 hypothetical protein WS81_17555 [Burkholderia sp. MSMB2040]KVG95271.1 hypothetical protein WS83_05310 [Burkholderia sp. MSMB2042]KVG99433.1 hypothetical protein WS82_24815 [Burkholderia sp. MSMB2041]KVK85171.1 hypothetical protein WS91_04025 [Burkholderia sp. MSMB1498]
MKGGLSGGAPAAADWRGRRRRRGRSLSYAGRQKKSRCVAKEERRGARVAARRLESRCMARTFVRHPGFISRRGSGFANGVAVERDEMDVQEGHPPASIASARHREHRSIRDPLRAAAATGRV